MAIDIAQKNRLCFEIMKLTFQLDLLISQAPLGLKFNMTAAQLATYNAIDTQKAAMMAELFHLMQLDRDI
ncbi:unnamed protein product [Rotaria sordida]|uniref:Uncharacterized protein n=1 Tax=Rotaria sordida TaxID=392033 RepID=A0A813W3E2_9BILA|nr:unnamed protein product [Rotaria sordida]CAF0849409.1 unnamed protein product [Rotaria sordida]